MQQSTTAVRRCAVVRCAWLQGHLDDDWFPAKSGIIVHFSQDAVNVTVDDHCPDRWREEPYFSKLAEWSLNGHQENRKPRLRDPRRLRRGQVFAAWTDHRSRTDAVRNSVRACSPPHVPVLAGDIARSICSGCTKRIAQIERIRQEFGSCAIPDEPDDDPYPPYRPALLR